MKFTLNQIGDVAEKLIEQFHPRQVITLSGDLGAGKTTLVAEVVKKRGGTQVSSPTFVFHNIYETDLGEVDHLDLYRIASDGDLDSIGFWDIFDRETGLIFIEWPEKLPKNAIPSRWNTLSLSLEIVDPETRKVSFESD